MSENISVDFNFLISDTAKEHFARLLQDRGSDTGLRVSVVNPGTPAAEVDIEYCGHGEELAGDTPISYDSFKVFFCQESIGYLNGASVDFESEQNGSTHLVINAPNLKKNDLPEDASLKEKVEHVFETQINNSLAEHGGMVSLIDVQGNDIYVRFQGGCQGCSMVNVTLKNGIEAKLRSLLPEIGQVIDATDHSGGHEPYYT